MKKIYIIMINYNGADDTCCCIKSLKTSFESISELDYNVVLVDNASSDSDIVKIKDFIVLDGSEKITLIQNNKNYGFAKANNIGIHYLQNNNLLDNESYIWFLNNDTILSSELIVSIKNNLPKEKEVVYFEMRNFNNDFVNDGLNYISLVTGKYSESIRKNAESYICGASIFLKWDEAFPLWDESYFLYFEDVEYSFLMKHLGYTFVKVNNAYYQHKINASSGKNPRTKFIRLQSQKIFMKKHSKHYRLFIVLKCGYLLAQLRIKELIFFLFCKA